MRAPVFDRHRDGGSLHRRGGDQIAALLREGTEARVAPSSCAGRRPRDSRGDRWFLCRRLSPRSLLRSSNGSERFPPHQTRSPWQCREGLGTSRGSHDRVKSQEWFVCRHPYSAIGGHCCRRTPIRCGNPSVSPFNVQMTRSSPHAQVLPWTMHVFGEMLEASARSAKGRFTSRHSPSPCGWPRGSEAPLRSGCR